ncbi:hypothetical protein GON26_00405 [Flavobacterium sp. GA093]|uniref:Uncharacterized protein n=1 Tax=Flavobacterium hydrocarbonoxydans TaxID=2683249 RepID=A0A6I4NDV7_9FLAO|nr:hypothetical protein [Flavobacterium hydrocarbonoxydans]MWB92816.1 hypothetical protein [Flavobacterium hydrocarbonoxydans]
MSKLLDSYIELLKIYTEEVTKLELLKDQENDKHSRWNPAITLNRSMFTYDEYLNNDLHRGYYFKEKNLIMPFLLKFIAIFENSSEEEKLDFENLKTKNKYQENLDDLVSNKVPLLDFLKFQLKELQELKYTYTIPFPPKRKNATLQQAKYEKDIKEYWVKANSLERCREEVNARIKNFEELKKH